MVPPGFAELAEGGRGRVRVHALSVARDMGGARVAVNGIARREVAAVVDEFGRGQVLDLSREEEDEGSE